MLNRLIEFAVYPIARFHFAYIALTFDSTIDNTLLVGPVRCTYDVRYHNIYLRIGKLCNI